MKLSVIIIGYNSWNFLEKCFASLLFLMNDVNTEIIYVDNASTDESVKKIKALYPSVIVIENHANLGVPVARNRGIKTATGKYIWILDSDTESNEESYKSMLQFMDKNSSTGICACKLIGQDGKAQASCRKFPEISKKLRAIFNIIFKIPYSSIQYNLNSDTPFKVDYLIGACQFIRKEALDKTGLLDENIFYAEDADICLRMKQAGYDIYYLPQVSMYHAYQRISSRKPFSKLSRKHFRDLIYYFWKHKGTLFFFSNNPARKAIS